MGSFFQVPTKIHFGINQLKGIGQILSRYGNKCLLVTTEDVEPLDQLFTRIKQLLASSHIHVIHFDKVIPNPTVAVVEEGIRMLQQHDIDVVLSVGGGSSIDTAKTIALLNSMDTIHWEQIFQTYTDPHESYLPLSKKQIPHISVPTTAGTGSEVTQAAVISMGSEKNTIFHPDNYATEALLDPVLLTTLPKSLTASTGFDAFCHAFESYINPHSSPYSKTASLEAIQLIKGSLPPCLKDLKNTSLREDLLYAQSLGGIALSNAGAAAPHPLSEIIGGITHISHGEALALIFPEFLNANYMEFVTEFATVARIFEPSLCSEEDRIATSKLSSIIKDFLVDISLYNTFDTYGVTDDQFNAIMNCPILGFLPFGSKEVLQNIILASKMR